MSGGVPAWAVPGAKVVCVSSFGGHVKWYIPKKGMIYTIAWTEPDHQDGPMLEFAEIGAPMSIYKFPVSCFRPLVTRSQEQDMAIFRPILDQLPVDA